MLSFYRMAGLVQKYNKKNREKIWTEMESEGPGERERERLNI